MQTIEEVVHAGFFLKSPDNKIAPSWALQLEYGVLVGCSVVNNDDGTASYPIWDNPLAQPTNDELQQLRTKWTTDCNLALLREERNKKLLATDYWFYADTPEPTQAQLDYRQALRDITETYSSLDDVVWPTIPQEGA